MCFASNDSLEALLASHALPRQTRSTPRGRPHLCSTKTCTNHPARYFAAAALTLFLQGRGLPVAASTAGVLVSLTAAAAAAYEVGEAAPPFPPLLPPMPPLAPPPPSQMWSPPAAASTAGVLAAPATAGRIGESFVSEGRHCAEWQRRVLYVCTISCDKHAPHAGWAAARANWRKGGEVWGRMRGGGAEGGGGPRSA